MTDQNNALREAARAIADHDLFYDREYLSADLNSKLDALRAALAAMDTPKGGEDDTPSRTHYASGPEAQA